MKLANLFEDRQKDFLSQLKESLLRLKTKGVEAHLESTTNDRRSVHFYAQVFSQEVQKIEEVLKNAKTNGTARKALRTILKEWKEKKEWHNSRMMKSRGKDFDLHAGRSCGFRELLYTIYPLNFDVRLDKSKES